MKLVRRFLLILLILLGFLFGCLYIFRQQIAKIVLKRTVASLSRAISGEVSYKTIQGDIFSHPRITGLRIIVQSDTVLIDTLQVKYDLIALFQQRILLLNVRIVEPDIRIGHATPKQAVTQERTRLRFPRLSLRHLQVINGKIILIGVKRIDSLGLNLSLFSSGPMLKLQLDSAWCRLVKEGLVIRQASGQATIRNDSLTLTGVQIFTDFSRVAGGLNLDLRTGNLAVDSVEMSVDIEELVPIPGRVWLQGKGKFGQETRMQANCQVAGLSYNQVKLPGFSGRFTLIDSALLLRLSGANETLGSFAIDAGLNLTDFLFNARIALDSVPVNKFASGLPEFSLWATVLAEGRLGTLAQLLKMPGEKIKEDSIYLLFSGNAKELGIDTLYATVTYQARRAELRELVLYGPIGEFQFRGVARKGLIAATSKMADFDLAVAGRFFSLPMTGRADGSIKVAGAGDSWEFAALVRVNGFSVEGIEVSNGLIQADLAGSGFFQKGVNNLISGRVAIGGEGVRALGQDWNWAQFVWTGPEFDLQVEKEEQRLLASGVVSFEKSAIKAVVRTLEIIGPTDTVALYDSCQVEMSGDSLLVSGLKVKIADGELKLDALGLRGGMPELKISAQNLNLGKLKQLLGLTADLSGTLTFDISGQDTLFFAFSGVDIVVPAANIIFKYLDGSALVTKGWVSLNSLRFVHQGDTSSFSGILQFKTKDGFHLTGMDLEIGLADPGIWPLVVTKPYVEISEGQLYGALKLNWTQENLNLAGRLRVNNGSLSIPSVEGKVDRFQAELTLKGNRILLEKMSGRTVKGMLTAEGFAQLSPVWRCDSLRYSISFTGASAEPITGVYAIGDGDISVFWRDGEMAFISGRALISEALATIGFGAQSGDGVSSSGGVDYDITVKAERGVWLRNRDTDIELGVDLVVRKVGEEGLFSGEMKVKQGSIYYLDHTLRVTQGSLSFENSSEFDPQLNITAECPVPGKKANAPEKIVLKLTGTLKSPSFVFYSEPPLWDETQIITYLSLNLTMDELSALEQKELVSRLLSNRLLGYFQTQASKRVRDFIGLDYLEVETGLSGDEARVTVGKYVGRNLYISYTQNFTGELQPAFRVEYNLNRYSELLAERSALGRYSFRYRFKLRF